MQKTIFTIRGVSQDLERRGAFISDLAQLIDVRVAALGGVRGLFVKKTYGIVIKARPNYVARVLTLMANDFVDAFEPLHGTYLEPLVLPAVEIPSLEDFLMCRRLEVCSAFFQVSDRFVSRHQGTVVGKAYRVLRPHLEPYLVESIPDLAKIIEKHTVVLIDA